MRVGLRVGRVDLMLLMCFLAENTRMGSFPQLWGTYCMQLGLTPSILHPHVQIPSSYWQVQRRLRDLSAARRAGISQLFGGWFERGSQPHRRETVRGCGCGGACIWGWVCVHVGVGVGVCVHVGVGGGLRAYGCRWVNGWMDQCEFD